MPARIPDDIRNQVIKQWLSGDTRDKISIDNKLGAGTVTNIVNCLLRDLGIPTADALRQLAVSLKNMDTSPSACAQGFRIINKMKMMGWRDSQDADRIESFLNEFYNACLNAALAPEKSVDLLKQLFDISKVEGIPATEVPNHINNKIKEKRQIEFEINTLKEQKRQAESDKDKVVQEKRSILDALSDCIRAREELQKHGISMKEDPASLVNLLNNAKLLGYDLSKIVTIASSVESLQRVEKELERKIHDREERTSQLEQELDIVSKRVEEHKKLLEVAKKLESMTLNVQKLEQLSKIINGIAVARGIPVELAFSKLVSDISSDYDNKVGFETALNNLETQVGEKLAELNALETAYADKRISIDVLYGLHSRGIEEKDIIYFDILLKNQGISKEPLSKDVAKYGTIKSTIKELEYKKDELEAAITSLTAQVDSLKKEKVAAEENIKTMFQVANLTIKEVATNTITEVINAAIAAKNEVEIEKLDSAFVPLIRLECQGVSDIDEVRRAVIDSMEIMLGLLEENSAAKPAIEKTIELLKQEKL